MTGSIVTLESPFRYLEGGFERVQRCLAWTIKQIRQETEDPKCFKRDLLG